MSFIDSCRCEIYPCPMSKLVHSPSFCSKRQKLILQCKYQNASTGTRVTRFPSTLQVFINRVIWRQAATLYLALVEFKATVTFLQFSAALPIRI